MYYLSLVLLGNILSFMEWLFLLLLPAVYKKLWTEVNYQYQGVVFGLAEMELIFPIAALIVLCFVLVAIMVLTRHQCFG